MFAVIRVRGRVKTPRKIEDTLKMLRLKAVNNCVLMPETPSIKGMLQKALILLFLSWIIWEKIKYKGKIIEHLRTNIYIMILFSSFNRSFPVFSLFSTCLRSVISRRISCTAYVLPDLINGL